MAAPGGERKGGREEGRGRGREGRQQAGPAALFSAPERDRAGQGRAGSGGSRWPDGDAGRGREGRGEAAGGGDDAARSGPERGCG